MKPSDIILRKALVAANIPSKDWSMIHASLRNRAFFMSRVTEQKLLSAARQGVASILDGAKDKSELRRDLRKMISDGMRPTDPKLRGTIQDIFTKQRLDTMIDTNVRQAKGYANHLQATKPGALKAFPGYELIRIRQSRQPRDWQTRWNKAAREVGFEGVARNGQMIALKTSPIWVKLSVFGNPFPPFDWGSGMGLDDVERERCKALGLVGKGIPEQEPPKLDLNGHLEAEIPDTRRDSLCGQTLERLFGDQIRIENGKVKWQGNIIQDVIAGKAKKVYLGEGYDGSKLSLSHQFFIEHGGKHLDPNEPYAHLTPQEFELLPTLWRKPDRIVQTRDPNRTQLELDTLDGGFILAIVDKRNGLKSIQKRIGSGGSIT